MVSGISIPGVAAPAVAAPAPVADVTLGAPSKSVGPVEPPLPVAGRGGNPRPPAGETLPAAAPAPQPQLIELQAAVDGVNKFLRDNEREMLFQVDLKSGRTVVTIVNPATGDVIRQIPAAAAIAAAANLQQAGLPVAGLFVNALA